MKDGSPLTFRPLRPEDEPAWHAFLSRCSEKTLWSRFRYVFKESTHEMATRFCFIDYDRTIAIAAEDESYEGADDDGRLVAIGRLVADPDHRTAEYAILVEDAWQGRGLGAAMTAYCMEICRDWKIDRVTGETTADNRRMQTLFRNHGFSLVPTDDAEEMLFRRRFSDSP
ncbi:MAG: GNAT family N-acetyltransferase [Planctomycetales bacterium]|nr:GNAT family N-acetyltransferase [Planctomycetales bacterium]